MPFATKESSAVDGYAVTPTDDTDLTNGPTKALWVGGGGNIQVVFQGNATAVILNNVAAGTLLPVQVIQVESTNTTATNIVALY